MQRLLAFGVWILLSSYCLAETFGDFNYTTNEIGVKITGYTGTNAQINIPDSINGLPVKIIGQSSFQGMTTIEKVNIPNSILKIESYAFYGCSSLNEINFSSNLTHIGTPETGGAVFEGCTSLTNIILPDSLTYLNGSMFSGTSIEKIVIPPNVVFIGSWAFNNINNLKEVKFRGPMPILGIDIFYQNDPDIKIKYISGLSGWSNLGSALVGGHVTAPLIPYAAAIIIPNSSRGSASISPIPSIENNTAYPLNSSVTITALPNTNFAFSHWSGSISSTNNPLTLTLNTGKTILPNFFIPSPQVFTSLSRPIRQTNFPLSFAISSQNQNSGSVFSPNPNNFIPENSRAGVQKILFQKWGSGQWGSGLNPICYFKDDKIEVYSDYNNIPWNEITNKTGLANITFGAGYSGENSTVLLFSNKSIQHLGYIETNSFSTNKNSWREERAIPATWTLVSTPENTNNFVQVENNGSVFIGLKSDGTVVGWGYSRRKTLPVPEGLTNVVQISVGGDYALALRSDGTIFGWGAAPDLNATDYWIDNKGQEMPPENLTNAVSISAGMEHSLALLDNGTVVAWGDNTYGQCDVPSNLINVCKISAGLYGSAAILENGDVVAWGFSMPSVPSMDQYLSNINPNNLKNVFEIGLGTETYVITSFNTFRLAIINDNSKGIVLTDPAMSTNGYFSENQIVEITVNPSPGYLFSSFSGDISETNNSSIVLMDTNKNISVNYVNDLRDLDNDGLSNFDEIKTYNTDPSNADSNADGIIDGSAVSLGYSPFFNFLPLVNYLRTNPVSGLYTTQQIDQSRNAGRADVTNSPATYGLYSEVQFNNNYNSGRQDGRADVLLAPNLYSLYTESQFNANFSNGQQDVLSNPNNNGLYTTNQIHNLVLGGIILNRGTNNELTLNYQILESTDLVNWTTNSLQLPITNAPSDKMFLRVQAVGQ